MLPLLGLRKNNIVGFLLSPTQLLCSWVKPTKNSFTLQAFNKIPLTYTDAPATISGHLQDFVCMHRLHNAYTIIALSGDTLREKELSLPNAAAVAVEQLQLPEFETLIWDYQPQPNNKKIYVCGIKREHLAQHQLMCIHAKLNCIVITSEQAIRNLMQIASAPLHSTFNNTDDEKLLCLGMYHAGNNI